MEVKTKTLKVNLYNIPLKHSSSCDKRKTKMSTNVLKVLRMKKATILHNLLLLFVFIFIFILPKISSAADTITPSLSIQDGETIVSSTQHFELGFFSNDDTKSSYLGIWYKKIQPQTIVWVANRNNPITDSTGVLKIGDSGNLELVDQASRVVWSSNVTQVFNPVAQLLDNGNLVIREEGNIDPKDYLWQSFDHPTDTLLPEMKLGWNLKSGLERTLTSWKTASDPSTGDYTFRIDRHGLPQTFILNKFVPLARSGSWNGKIFTGLPLIKQSQIFNFNYRSNEDDLFYSFSLKNESVYSRLVMSQSGQIQRYTWLENAQAWKLFWSFPTDQCDDYNECGANAICSVKDLSVCSCLSGFEPKNPADWDMRDGSGGCMQKTRSDCQKSNGFLQLKKMKLPDTSLSFVDSSMNLKECEAECRRNCSCKAYANLDITNGGSGCIMWFDELLDLREYDVEGQDLYIRVAISPLGDARRKYNKDDSERKKTVVLVTTLTLILTLFLLIFGFCLALRKKIVKIMQNRTANKRVHQETSQELPLVNLGKSPTRESASSEPIDELELRLFDLCTMATATDNFSVVNKLGQGGFGCVYKGILEDGQQIAVKRLSKSSSQGVEEFKNEIILIAKLQHRNLVRLLGHCFEGEEKLLVYEYMENKSLDSFLFDTSDNFTLDWQTRFNIIVGIARGLLYLHQDSRFRIIHRDLKPTNVLLDADMNPKISDFGMARIFGGDQTEANTRRVVGTYGYMSPEYAMDGRFSIKSDIFSLGVLMLEIISGIKNGGFYSSNNHVNLLGHAWKLWIEGNGLNLVDTSIGDSYPASEVLRCVQIALLCVQERADDRPNMASVVLMLISENPTMPQPKKAGFCFVEATAPAPAPANEDRSDNSNQITITMLEAR